MKCKTPRRRWDPAHAMGRTCLCRAVAAPSLALVSLWLLVAPCFAQDDLLDRRFGGEEGLGVAVAGDRSFAEIPRLDTLFPDGVRVGDGSYDALFVNRAGALSFDRPLVYSAEGLPRAPIGPPNPILAPFMAHVALDAPDDLRHQVYVGRIESARARSGALAVTWFDMGHFEGRFEALNRFQMILTDVGGGDARVELRFDQCQWAGVDGVGGAIRGAFLGFDDGDGFGWTLDGGAAPLHDLRRLCTRSNIDIPGIWQFDLRGGVLSGCGDGRWDPGAGEACDDGNMTLADGCSTGCVEELDLDGDGHFEAPAGRETMHVDDAIYDDCVPEEIWPEGPGCEADIDRDGVHDARDNCPDDPNPRQENGDADSSGDVCDLDDDNDGWLDVEDNCPDVRNPPEGEAMVQADADGDGVGDACDPDFDGDGDGVSDPSDNCPAVANPSQEDGDGDGAGDACDGDQDGDGVDDDRDNCPSTPNPSQLDMDDDGSGDPCDEDRDGNGLLDARECPGPAGARGGCAAIPPSCAGPDCPGPGGGRWLPPAHPDAAPDAGPEPEPEPVTPPHYAVPAPRAAVDGARCSASPGRGGSWAAALLLLLAARRRAAPRPRR